LSLKRVLKTLEGFGLSSMESKVYVYLAKVGPSNAIELTHGLGVTKQQLIHTLRNLKKKGIVTSAPESSELFSAIAFEELLYRYIEVNAEKAKAIRETKQELVNNWQNVTRQNDSR
jgi:sugar-specific transcriptional regulator TrmB